MIIIIRLLSLPFLNRSSLWRWSLSFPISIPMSITITPSIIIIIIIMIIKWRILKLATAYFSVCWNEGVILKKTCVLLSPRLLLFAAMFCLPGIALVSAHSSDSTQFLSLCWYSFSDLVMIICDILNAYGFWTESLFSVLSYSKIMNGKHDVCWCTVNYFCGIRWRNGNYCEKDQRHMPHISSRSGCTAVQRIV